MEIINPPKEVLSAFNELDVVTNIIPFGGGHINSTYKVSTPKTSFIVQKINIHVFNRPKEVMSNISKAAEFLKTKNYSYKILEPLLAKNKSFYTIYGGEYWRMFPFIEGTITVEKADDEHQAYEAAYAFGHFTDSLKGLDCNSLYFTIYDFHNFEKRLVDFKNSIAKGNPLRLKESRNVIDQLLEDSAIINEITSLTKNIPLRPIHSDSKISNILMDEKTNKAVCVIDLDTIMPGHVFYDYGDMVRSFANTTVEDDPNVPAIDLDWKIFEALTRGFTEAIGKSLSAEEWKTLLPGAIAVIYVQALRFLADYLVEDVYYKTDYEKHNLDRAINQTAYYRTVMQNSEKITKLLEDLKG
ncbi:MAG: aminoglycoside phosphotransferase family protein [Cyclobacteriaceae bacterium]|nr:aminoglycoside phosphotransferase family protein [Cyclobacteriaceae bacterium]